MIIKQYDPKTKLQWLNWDKEGEIRIHRCLCSFILQLRPPKREVLKRGIPEICVRFPHNFKDKDHVCIHNGKLHKIYDLIMTVDYSWK
jgi:hypothetical protein